ncbi:MAG TPA: hypothetical protein VKH44_01790, partial [Pirellulaceae bacterium]|nr:hypothetical protein [Pirellulaceae bacterium]
MSPSLPNRVQQVQTIASRLMFFHGLARFAVAVVLAITGLGFLDYLLRLHDPLARWLLSASLLATVIFAFNKLVLPSLRVHQSPIGTARRIELRFPVLRERLSSAIAFLSQSQDDPTAGSPVLRRATIAQAEAIGSGLDFRAALDHRAPRRAMLAAAAALAVAAILPSANPPAAGLAFARLIQPWRDLSWPRRHELAFEQATTRLAKGDDLELVLIDRRGILPNDLRLLIRHETPTGWRTETKQLKPLGERMIFRLENVTRGLEYRAWGGDDDTMPWTELIVVEPPKIVELQIIVEPPAYTGLAPRSEGQIVNALVGSKLRIRGKLDQPIQAATLKSASPGVSIPAAEILADRRQFQSPPRGSSWIVEQSGTFSLELTDQHGISFGKGTRIELHAVQDTPPSIAWAAPAEHTFVTAGAALPLKAVVKDDLAVRSVQLRYLRPGNSDEEQIVDLYVGQASSLPNKSAPSESESQRIDYTWDLSRLAGLVSGDVLAIRLTAEDYKPQLATTTVRRVTVISDEDLQSRIATRQAAILSQLADALRMAQQCREQSRSLEIRFRETGQVLTSDLNLLQAAQHNLRQVQRLLAGAPEGAAGQIASLLVELTANHAEQHASSQRLRDLLSQVQGLTQGQLPAIDQEL